MNTNMTRLRAEVAKHLEDAKARTQVDWWMLTAKVEELLKLQEIFYDQLGDSILVLITNNAMKRWPHVTAAQATVYFIESLQLQIYEKQGKKLTSGDVWETITLMQRRQDYSSGPYA